MIRAFVFDLDGTLVETEELKALSYARAATELRPALREDEVVEAFKDLVGLSRQEVERDTDVVLLSCCPGPEGVTRSSALRPLLLVLLWGVGSPGRIH